MLSVKTFSGASVKGPPRIFSQIATLSTTCAFFTSIHDPGQCFTLTSGRGNKNIDQLTLITLLSMDFEFLSILTLPLKLPSDRNKKRRKSRIVPRFVKNLWFIYGSKSLHHI